MLPLCLLKYTPSYSWAFDFGGKESNLFLTAKHDEKDFLDTMPKSNPQADGAYFNFYIIIGSVVSAVNCNHFSSHYDWKKYTYQRTTVARYFFSNHTENKNNRNLLFLLSSSYSHHIISETQSKVPSSGQKIKNEKK